MDQMISTRFSGCPGSCLHETENEIFSMMVREDTNHGTRFSKHMRNQGVNEQSQSLSIAALEKRCGPPFFLWALCTR